MPEPKWLRYLPGTMIQERSGVTKAYVIADPTFRDWELGRVEQYYDERKQRLLWRTLDHWKNDWKSGFLTREKAAQDLVENCPRTQERLKLIETLRDRETNVVDAL